jgi:hypothetical protein
MLQAAFSWLCAGASTQQRKASAKPVALVSDPAA